MEAGPRVPPRGAARHRGSAAQRDEDRSYHRVLDGWAHSHGLAQGYRVVVGRAAVADAGRDPGRPTSRHRRLRHADGRGRKLPADAHASWSLYSVVQSGPEAGAAPSAEAAV